MKESSHTVSSHVRGNRVEKPKLFSQKESIFWLLLNIVYIATLEHFFPQWGHLLKLLVNISV